MITDAASGSCLGIARWHDGRRAALSIRFDDSHPTHLTKAVPILARVWLPVHVHGQPGAAEPGSGDGPPSSIT